MSKFYYNPNLDRDKQTGIKSREEIEKQISFMIFRTGSVLIVGKCIENELMDIYEFLKKILIEECDNIIQGSNINDDVKSKKKTSKKIKRKITVTNNS